jgi:DNA-directed RNA polymerase subunit RPC12/RpoP
MSETDAATAREGKADRYPCPNCGADTALQPGAESLSCSHCGHLVKIDADGGGPPIHEHDFRDALSRLQRRPADQMAAGAREVQCQNCGARTVVTVQATRCPFCDNALVVQVEASADTIVPESVLPFGIDKGKAGELFQVWLKKRWFAPFDLVKRAKRDGLDGVYLPYWSFDSETATRYRGARGEHYWDTEEYRDSQGKRQTRRVRRTRWYPASGTVDVRFDDVLVCATPTLPRNLLDKLEPWDLPQLKPFDGKYLAGFVAERYRVELEDGFKIAEQRMEPRIRQAITRDIGGDEQRVHWMTVRHDQVKFKHLLLPLWMSSFRYGEKVYRVTVNARTGEIAGQRPYSWFKILLLVLVIAALIAGAVYLAYRSKKPKPPAERTSITTPIDHGGSVRLGMRPSASAPSPFGTYDIGNGPFMPLYRRTS